jgi:secreted PhoX family phosphatase
MQRTTTRATFLKHSVTFTGLAFAGPALLALGNPRAARATTAGYGPLKPVGEGHLALPDGFTYKILRQEGDLMSDGHPTPGVPDGQAFFPHPDDPDLWRVVCNHELHGRGTALGNPAKAYDSVAQAGNTIYDIEPATMTVVNSFIVSSGTDNNCSGGKTPRNTWLTCEENVVGTNIGFGQKHGYVYEIPSQVSGQITPQPIPAMGRFVHEAAVTDPNSGIVYMTEDNGPKDGFYRFLPKNRNDLHQGGMLQMLAVNGKFRYDTRTGQTPGTTFDVHWVTIEDPDPKVAGKEPGAVFKQGQHQGGAAFIALEGCTFANGQVTFVASDGGDAKIGQVWRYNPTTRKLTLLYEATDKHVLEGPDNVAISPRGSTVLCEDGDYAQNFIRGLTPSGDIVDFALNLTKQQAEFAGAIYTPDGKWLVVHIQDPGITFAITGPWGHGLL